MTNIFRIVKASKPTTYTARDGRELASSVLILQGGENNYSPQYKVEVRTNIDYTSKIGSVVVADLHFYIDSNESGDWQRIHCRSLMFIKEINSQS